MRVGLAENLRQTLTAYNIRRHYAQQEGGMEVGWGWRASKAAMRGDSGVSQTGENHVHIPLIRMIQVHRVFSGICSPLKSLLCAPIDRDVC